MKLDFSLKGAIIPLTPINISRPAEGRAEEAEKGVPMMTIVNGGGPVRVPVIPGETIKGLLRAASSDLATRGRKLSLSMYNTVYKGGIKGSEKETVDDLLKTTSFRNSNPVLGLYGAAAPRWVAGCLSVLGAIPASPDQVAVTLSNGVRRDDFRLQPQRLEQIEEEAVEGYLRYAAVAKEISRREAETEKLGREIWKLKNPRDGAKKAPDAAERIKQAEAVIKENNARVEELKDSGDFKNTVGRPLPNKAGIAPGSILNQGVEGRGVSEKEFGLFLETLRALRHECRIGGLRSIGYGYFKAEWSLMVREEGEEDFADAGIVTLAPSTFELRSTHPAVARSLAAWNEGECDLSALEKILAEAA